jgi:hypothetical protein
MKKLSHYDGAGSACVCAHRRGRADPGDGEVIIVGQALPPANVGMDR